MDRVVTIYINREQEAVVVKARSPPAATRYPEGGTSVKTGPGRHTGSTAEGREATTDREGCQYEPNNNTRTAEPTQTHRGAQQKQRKPRDAQTEASDRKTESPVERNPTGNEKPQKGQRTAEKT